MRTPQPYCSGRPKTVARDRPGGGDVTAGWHSRPRGWRPAAWSDCSEAELHAARDSLRETPVVIATWSHRATRGSDCWSGKKRGIRIMRFLLGTITDGAKTWRPMRQAAWPVRSESMSCFERLGLSETRQRKGWADESTFIPTQNGSIWKRCHLACKGSLPIHIYAVCICDMEVGPEAF